MVAIANVFWLVLTATVATASTIVRRDFVTVKEDITDRIGPSWTILNDDINAFPGNEREGAAAVRDDLVTLAYVLTMATSNVKEAGTFSVANGKEILGDIQSYMPELGDALVTLGTQKPSWEAIANGKKEVLKRLQDGKDAASNYIDAIIAAEPLNQEADAVAVGAEVRDRFDIAIAIYSA
ncbi:hypothetical protein V8C35DRAFT_329039 [Trichoderma chlorosporum]